MSDRSLVAGVVLLLIGIYILLSRRVGFSGPGPVLLLIGSGFLILSALRRWRGPIAPGAILVGLGAGFLFQGPMETLLPRWATLVLGLGAGFLLAAALEAAAGRLRAPGPIVPGTILVATALLAAVVELFDLPTFPLARSRVAVGARAGRRRPGHIGACETENVGVGAGRWALGGG